jgi:hypothetical protein
VTPSEGGGTTDQPAPPEDEGTVLERRKMADSKLRMAKTFAESRPDKARKYAEEVIQLVPDSPQAAEAKALLKGLE